VMGAAVMPDVAELERDAVRYQPVIVLAPARSCSSVVTAMLGQHPSLYGFPELTLFGGATVGDVLAGDPRDDREWHAFHLAGLHRAVAHLIFGSQTVAAVASAARWLETRSLWPSVLLFDYLQRLVEPQVAIEKAPDTTGTDVAILRAIIGYPRARFLHLVRHPVTTMLSMYDHWRDQRARSLPPVTLETTCAAVWYSTHLRIRKLTAEFAPERTLRVRAEEVLGNPPRELAKIATWLGLPADEDAIAAMQHPERSQYACVGPETARGGNDDKFLRHPYPHAVEMPDSLNLPAGWKIGHAERDAIVGLAHDLGYRDGRRLASGP
jgi:hypothetical protein